MTTTAYDEPPRQVDDIRGNPRPPADRYTKWPFILGGTVAVIALAGVTIGPSFWQSEATPVRVDPDTRLSNPRPTGPMDYTQVKPEPQPEPTPEQPQPQAPAPSPAPQRAYGGGQSNGPTKAELLKQARMSDFKTVAVAAPAYVGEEEGVGGGGGSVTNAATGSKLYSKHGLSDPFPCQVNAGTNIPAMTEQRITSESPGTVSAIVTRDIWSADKRCLAIPRGTRFVGKYQTQVSEGQARLGIAWTGLTRPPPRNDTIDLDDTVAGDPDGTAGVSGEVNSFFWRKLAFVAASSVLDIGKTVVTASGDGGVGSAIAGIFANRATSPVDEWARKQLDIPSVIQVEPREISVVLAQHIPMNEFRPRR